MLQTSSALSPLLINQVWQSPQQDGLQLRLAQTKKELRAVQRLRF
ncbi:MAG: GNAT family N-acetyltransferase, partial [Alcaligenaceae bacterium]|nr:GNAT family N-acetyltransferase [Alcaligenaceae bacterium]